MSHPNWFVTSFAQPPLLVNDHPQFQVGLVITLSGRYAGMPWTVRKYDVGAWHKAVAAYQHEVMQVLDSWTPEARLNYELSEDKNYTPTPLAPNRRNRHRPLVRTYKRR